MPSTHACLAQPGKVTLIERGIKVPTATMTHMQLLVLQLPRHGPQQRALPRPRGTEQQRHAAGLEDAAAVVQQHHLALVVGAVAKELEDRRDEALSRG